MKNKFRVFNQIGVCLLFTLLFSECKNPPAITEKMIKRAKAGNGDNTSNWDFLANKLRELKNEVPGVNINQKALVIKEATALHYAVALGGSTDITLALIARSAKIDAKTKDDTTPLHTAVYNGKKKIAELLIKSGADINVNAKDRGTPLHIAANYGHKEIVQLLLTNGAKVNAQDEDGFTPLHRAVCYGHKEVVKLLLNNEADVNALDVQGRTPIDWANNQNKNGSHDQIIAILSK